MKKILLTATTIFLGITSNCAFRCPLAIHEAVIKGDLEKVKKLIKKNKKKNIEATDFDCRTPLYIAVRNAIYSKGTGKYKETLADINYEQNVPISTYLNIIKYLVKQGANVEAIRLDYIYPERLLLVDNEIIIEKKAGLKEKKEVVYTPLLELILSENSKRADIKFKDNIFKIIKYLAEKGKAKITDEMIEEASDRVKKYLKQKKEEKKIRKEDFEERVEFLLKEIKEKEKI